MEGRDNKGRFGPGNPGRPKGAKNKTSSKLREALDQIRDKVFTVEQITEDLKKVSPAVRLSFYREILEFDLPKLSRTESTVSIEDYVIPKVIWADEIPQKNGSTTNSN